MAFDLRSQLLVRRSVDSCRLGTWEASDGVDKSERLCPSKRKDRSIEFWEQSQNDIQMTDNNERLTERYGRPFWGTGPFHFRAGSCDDSGHTFRRSQDRTNWSFCMAILQSLSLQSPG